MLTTQPDTIQTPLLLLPPWLASENNINKLKELTILAPHNNNNNNDIINSNKDFILLINNNINNNIIIKNNQGKDKRFIPRRRRGLCIMRNTDKNHSGIIPDNRVGARGLERVGRFVLGYWLGWHAVVVWTVCFKNDRLGGGGGGVFFWEGYGYKGEGGEWFKYQF